MLDADEVLSDELVQEIKTFKKKPLYNVYKLKIVDMFPTDVIPSKFANQFNPVRLYNRKFARMPSDCMNKDRVKVNDGVIIGQMNAFVHHYSVISIEDLVTKFNTHSTELQKTLEKEGRCFSVLRLIVEFPYQFLKYYFGKKYVFRGAYGFIMANVIAYFRFLKVAKRFEDKLMKGMHCE